MQSAQPYARFIQWTWRPQSEMVCFAENLHVGQTKGLLLKKNGNDALWIPQLLKLIINHLKIAFPTVVYFKSDKPKIVERCWKKQV